MNKETELSIINTIEKKKSILSEENVITTDNKEEQKNKDNKNIEFITTTIENKEEKSQASLNRCTEKTGEIKKISFKITHAEKDNKKTT